MELEVETRLSRRPALEPNDPTALTDAQQTSLNQHKVKVRAENEFYLRKHPEITVMISSFMREILLARPDNIKVFAAEYFTDPALKDKAIGNNEN